jgi:hypothetical protein
VPFPEVVDGPLSPSEVRWREEPRRLLPTAPYRA